MKRISKTMITVLVLGVLAAVMIAEGSWHSSIITPLGKVFGQDVAASLDTSVRKGIDDTDRFVDTAQQKSLPELIAEVDTFDRPSNDRIPKYEREQFGDGWQFGIDGCSTREVVLKRDLAHVKMRNDRKCKVLSGVLDPDPYTGGRVVFNSVEDPMAVQIDHIVPLKAAWEMGAYAWSSNDRVKFSNDLENLIAADGPANNQKSDKTPSRWMPDNKSFTCDFASRYVHITEKYDLTMDAADAETLSKVLEQC